MTLLIGFFAYYALFPTTAKAESPGFGSATQYNIGYPLSVQLADLDGDGFDDMAVTRVWDHQVYVYINNGDGTFGSPTSNAVGYNPYHVEAVDLDNDGDFDLVTGNQNKILGGELSIDGENISILLNNGDGIFQPFVNYGVGSGSRYVYYGDLDNDGDQDLLSTNSDDGTLLIMDNNGDGTFVYDALYNVGEYPHAAIAGDIDQDGDLDILVSNLFSDNISILMNNGFGIFNSRIDYNGGLWPHAGVFADLDTNSGIDAAVANHHSNSVSVYLNDGTTLSPTCKQYQTGEYPAYTDAGDIDLDGDQDLIIVDHRGNSTSILINQGDGTFNGPLTYDAGNRPISVAVSDLDNDGDLDMAVANYFGGNVTVRLNQLVETGAFPSPTNSAYVSDCDSSIAPLSIITEAPLPSGAIGEAYSVMFTATGGEQPYTWNISAGSVPPGLSLDATTGKLSGTPTVAGTYGFTIQVIDSGGRASSRIYAFDPPPSNGSTGSSYTQPIHIDPSPNDQNDDGDSCSSYTVVSGNLPEGLTLDPDTGIVSGTPMGSGSYQFTVGCTIDNGPLQGQAAYKNFTIVITSPNLPPDVNANGPYEVNEGDEVFLNATGSDPDGDNLTYDWDLDNDGVYETPGQNVVFSAAEIDGLATQTVHVRATDPEGLSGQDSTQITINNVAPSVGAIDVLVDPFAVDTAISFSAGFTDPGIYDTHTAVWDWGDGNISPGTIAEAGGSGTVSDSHAYLTPGVYTVRLTVTDDDGGEGQAIYQYVVVYDPSGGFVTGGGWIDSPEGAYTPDPLLTGRANFGFVSKYKKGANTPIGETEFQFQVANLNFHSDSYDWLVVAGHKAMYKGAGVINGAGNYGFMISAIDEKLTPSTDVDLFRIKIWDKDNGDAIVYDNQVACGDGAEDAAPCTPIGGGNIVIHAAKAKAANVTQASVPSGGQAEVIHLPLIMR